MKKRWLYLCCMFALILSAGIFRSTNVCAEEKTVTVNGKENGVLQDGGLLKEQKPNTSKSRSSANTSAAEKEIMKGLDECQTEIDISKYNISISDISQIYFDILNKYPRYFYVSGKFFYSYSYDSNNVVAITPEYSDTTENVQKMTAQYNAKVKEIVSFMDDSWSDLEKVLYINDYLCTHAKYDGSLQKYNAYNLLVEGTAVCQGYALAYQELCNQVGIECELVTSSKLKHAWNLVKVNDQYYHVDSTWNDPVPDKVGRAYHTYLLKSSTWFQTTGKHTASDYVFSKGHVESNAGSTTFDDTEWMKGSYPFDFYGGYWYANIGGSIKKYQGSNSGMEELSTVKTFNDKWYVWGNPNSYYQGNYSGGVIYNDIFVYASPDSLRYMNLEDNSTGIIYQLSEDEKATGYIYGFSIDNGVITYCLATSPNEENGQLKTTVVCNHSYGDWTVIKAATCTEKGKREKICSKCGDKVIETIKATGHSYGAWQTKTVTCTEDGYKRRVCSVCKEEEKEVQKATGHRRTKTEKKSSNFVNTGYEKVTCLDCGKVVKNKTIAKLTCKKGSVYTVGDYKYKIVNNAVNGKGTVAFAGLSKNVTKVVIKASVKINGANFMIAQISDKALKNKTKITSVTIGKNVKAIGKEAFSGCKKLKTIKVSSTKLTKVGSKALKNIHGKAKIKVPKSKLKKYKNLFKSKGQKKTVKITK